jgi:hypothetical protein
MKPGGVTKAPPLRTNAGERHMTIQINSTSDAQAAALFNSAAAVDELLLLRAQIAKLEEKEKALTDALKATGLDRIAGTLMDCTVSRSERENLDVKSLKADLGEELIAPYRKAPIQIVTLRLVAKK